MKKIYTFLLISLLGVGAYAQTSNYNGNGNTGFGGAIGTSSLSIADDGTNITFTLTRGTGNFNDAFTIYIDSKAGGSSNTAAYTDQGDYLRRSISGVTGSGRSLLNFPTSPTAFLPDYAIAMTPVGGGTNFGGLWDLSTPSNFGFIASVNFTITPSAGGASATTYAFTCTKSQLGITGASINFNFVGTYGNPDGVGGYFRSNEAYGAGLASFTQGVNTATFTNSLTYPIIVTPLILGSFNGYVKNDNITINWTTLNESNLDKFLLQESSNGAQWTTAHSEVAKNNLNGATYSFVDNSLFYGSNYYRLISLGKTGDQAISKVIKIFNGKIDNNLTFFPNPTKENIKINFASANRGRYLLDIYNDAGQKLYTQQFDHNGTDKVIYIELPRNLKKGPYRVFISNQEEFYKGTFIVQ
jgi:Secretion system C-terminal sorting domain